MAVDTTDGKVLSGSRNAIKGFIDGPLLKRLSGQNGEAEHNSRIGRRYRLWVLWSISMFFIRGADPRPPNGMVG